VPVSSELPVGGDQEEPVFEEDFTQFVEEGKWLSPSALSFFEPMSLHVKQSLLFLLLCINLMGKHLVKDLIRYFTSLP
jgi:hypothetical protein